MMKIHVIVKPLQDENVRVFVGIILVLCGSVPMLVGGLYYLDLLLAPPITEYMLIHNHKQLGPLQQQVESDESIVNYKIARMEAYLEQPELNMDIVEEMGKLTHKVNGWNPGWLWFVTILYDTNDQRMYEEYLEDVVMLESMRETHGTAYREAANTYAAIQRVKMEARSIDDSLVRLESEMKRQQSLLERYEGQYEANTACIPSCPPSGLEWTVNREWYEVDGQTVDIDTYDGELPAQRKTERTEHTGDGLEWISYVVFNPADVERTDRGDSGLEWLMLTVGATALITGTLVMVDGSLIPQKLKEASEKP